MVLIMTLFPDDDGFFFPLACNNDFSAETSLARKLEQYAQRRFYWNICSQQHLDDEGHHREVSLFDEMPAPCRASMTFPPISKKAHLAVRRCHAVDFQF